MTLWTRAVPFACALCLLSIAGATTAPPVETRPDAIGVAVFVCNEWQGVSVYQDGHWSHFPAWLIVREPELQDLLRGIEFADIRLGERNFCTAFKNT